MSGVLCGSCLAFSALSGLTISEELSHTEQLLAEAGRVEGGSLVWEVLVHVSPPGQQDLHTPGMTCSTQEPSRTIWNLSHDLEHISTF